MEKDERLLPLPNAGDLNLTHQDVAAGYSPFYEDSFSEGRSIREYFLVVYKRLPLILALTILATAATAFYMYKQPSIYEAQTTMVMEPPKPKLQSKEAININLGGDANYYNTQLKLLQNPELMRDVVIRLNLQRDPNLFNQQNKGFISSLRSIFSSDKSAQQKEAVLPTLTETSAETPETKTVLTPEEENRAMAYASYLASGLSVEQVPATNLVNIKVQNPNPDLVAKVSDAVAAAFIVKDTTRETQGARTIYDELTKSIESLKATIAQKEQERLSQMQSSNLPLQENGDKLAAERLQAMSTQWLAAEDERRKVQAQYEAAVQASKNGQMPAVLADDKHIVEVQNLQLKRRSDLDAQIRGIENQIQDAESRRSQLLVRYTEEYPAVKAVDAQIKKLNEDKVRMQAEGEKRIAAEDAKSRKDVESQVLTILQAKLAAAQKSEAQSYSLYLKESGIAAQQGLAANRLTTLTREIETSRQLLDGYTQRQKEQELAISRDSQPNIFITSYAEKPSAPIGPNRNRNILIAFLMSLMAGIGLAFLFDYLDDSIKTSDDVGRYLGLPTLALIPHHNSVRKAKGNALTTREGNPASKALLSLEDNRSPMAEAYRHLRTSLLFSSAGKPPHTILVTSSQPSEGKTTTAINTAITLAQSGAEVVIIDCDLRRPRLHSHFDLENTRGLTNYLSGDKNTENLLKSYPGVPKLKILTSGPIPPNPAELLSSNEMKNLLQYLKGNFKHVVIDSPPAISFTDAAILSTLVDGVVLVAMAGKSSLHLMRRFKQRLSSIGARIYGVVINGIKPNSVEYGYYGYGYTYSYYEDGDDNSTPQMEETPAVHTIEK